LAYAVRQEICPGILGWIALSTPSVPSYALCGWLGVGRLRMRGLGTSGFQRPLEWLRRGSLLSRRDVLILASVTLTVACSVAFLGLRLQKLNEERQGIELGRTGEANGLPDVLGNRCSDQTPKRL
jgi:hypothetical protein